MKKNDKQFMMVHYTIKPGSRDKAEKAVRVFVKAVNAGEKRTLFYHAFKGKKPREYVHVMGFKDAKAERVHSRNLHTVKFVNVLYPLCEQNPVFMRLKGI